MEKIDNIRKAAQLARAIASDIAIYNTKLIEEGLQNDNVFDVLKAEIDEGRATFHGRVEANICDNSNIFEKALIDIILASRAHINTPIW